ncbi:MAG: beta-lactamase family protein [Deltaproteobacteria bacterium]|nr:beta-lactamase family protein [Deltaproteobacteria bacterium]
MFTKLLFQGISDGVFPGAVAYISEAGVLKFYEAVGNRTIIPRVQPMYKNTVFDLASLTKPIVTATLTLILAEREQLDVNAEVADYLPEFKRQGITIWHLLTHTSGLPAWKPLYLEPGKKEQVVAHLGEIPLAYPTGSRVVYSCLGYILLGKLIEHHVAQVCDNVGEGDACCGLDKLAHEFIFKPLRMSDTMYNPPPEFASQCAPTEDSNSFEKRKGEELQIESFKRYDWRDGVIVGTVHDENAHFLGGVAGNAGLFSTARDLAKFCEMLLDCHESLDGGNGILSQQSIELMTTNHTIGLNESRGLGWIILNDGSLYHTGFTGTSICINIARQVIAILLTNRVHPDALNTGIGDFREKFHQQVMG